MSLVAVHTLEINNRSEESFVALNTGKISNLEDRSGKAYFKFTPFAGRDVYYLIKEPMEYILNAPVQSYTSDLTITTVSGSLTISKENILKVYPHLSVDRTYLETVSGTEIGVSVAKSRMDDLIATINAVTVPSGDDIDISMDDVGSSGDSGIVWDDLQVDISLAKLPASNAPTWTNITIDGFTFKALAFDTNDYIDLFIQTTHSAKIEALIENHIHWTIANDDDGEEFQFQIEGIGGGIGDAFQSIGTIKSGDYLLSGNSGKHNLLNIGDIPAINTTVSSVFVVRLKRIAPDDGSDTAELIYVIFNDCHVRLDTTGSLNENSKT